MKSWLIGGAVVLIAVGVYVFFFHHPITITNYPPRDGNIVAFGDSLTAGIGSTEGHDFVSVLSHKIGRTILNYGIPGETTADALQRLETVADTNPSIVLVEFGGNDYLKRLPSDAAFENLKKIITTLQAGDAMIVLLGVRGGILQDNFASKFESLARETGSVYIPNILDGILGHQDLMYDEIHPNDAGYAIIANKIYSELVKVLH